MHAKDWSIGEPSVLRPDSGRAPGARSDGVLRETTRHAVPVKAGLVLLDLAPDVRAGAEEAMPKARRVVRRGT